MAAYIDPFCAPEFLVDDVAFRSMVGVDHIRFGYFTQEEGDRILRVKIVFPVRRLIDVHAETRVFVAAQQHFMQERLARAVN